MKNKIKKSITLSLVVVMLLGNTLTTHAQDLIYHSCPNCRELYHQSTLVNRNCTHCRSKKAWRYHCLKCGAVYDYCFDNDHLI